MDNKYQVPSSESADYSSGNSHQNTDRKEPPEPGSSQPPPSEDSGRLKSCENSTKNKTNRLGKEPRAKRSVNYLYIILSLVVLALVLMVYFNARSTNFYKAARETDVYATTVQDITPLSQLYVMTIHKEVLVGKHKRDNIIGSPEYSIYVIYPAKLQLGFDLSHCKEDWLVQRGDTTYVTLPPIEILNKDYSYVDESNRQVPVQTGSWTEQEMNSLREEANHRMVSQCTNEGCWELATTLGKDVIADLLKTLGRRHVIVSTEPLPLPSQHNQITNQQ